MVNQFTIFKNTFISKYKKLSKECELQVWNFYTNSTDKNMEALKLAKKNLDIFFKSNKIKDGLKKINPESLSKAQRRHYDYILKKIDNEALSKQKKELDDMEIAISQKYNKYVPYIDHQATSLSSINYIIQNEEKPEIRKKAYAAKIKGGNLIANDLKMLVLKRNEYAQKLGYDNFFKYKLKKEFNVDSIFLEKLLNEVYEKAKPFINKLFEEEKKRLKKVFHTPTLKAYHYGLLDKNGPTKRLNEHLSDVNQIIEIAKSTYNHMGFDINQLITKKRLVLDLLPRKNKNTHGFSFQIEPRKDSRILANLSNNERSLATLNHELGHCLYDLNYSKSICFLDKDTYPAITEAVAMMMETIHKKENILKQIVPANLLKQIKGSYAKGELLFLTRCLTFINFEKEMYNNPHKNFARLWKDMCVKYMGIDKTKTLDNEWATIPHFLSYPVYYQNYFRASLIKAQMYKHLTSELGELTKNKKTASYLINHLFKYGISKTENELIKNFTKKQLSSADFIRTISKKS